MHFRILSPHLRCPPSFSLSFLVPSVAVARRSRHSRGEGWKCICLDLLHPFLSKEIPIKIKLQREREKKRVQRRSWRGRSSSSLWTKTVIYLRLFFPFFLFFSTILNVMTTAYEPRTDWEEKEVCITSSSGLLLPLTPNIFGLVYRKRSGPQRRKGEKSVVAVVGSFHLLSFTYMQLLLTEERSNKNGNKPSGHTLSREERW